MRSAGLKSSWWIIFAVFAVGQQTELMPPSQSVAPAIVTADSGVRSSGVGTAWSEWYRLGIGKAPAGYTVHKTEFWLTGARKCGVLAECREVVKSDDQVLWEFRLRGKSESDAASQVISEAHIRVVYRPR